MLLTLVLSACSNAEPPALTALGSAADDSASPAASSNEPDETSADESTEGSLAFTFDFDPSLEALKAMTADDGVCAVFDAWFDASFSPSQPIAPDSGNDVAFIDDPSFAISTVKDGPFGEGWHTLITEQHDAADEGREANITPAQIAELDGLATEQCGYPVMTVLGVTDRKNCTTTDCTIAPDPRPALLGS